MRKILTITVWCFFVLLNDGFSQEVSDSTANNLLKSDGYSASKRAANQIYSEYQDIDELLRIAQNAINSKRGITTLADAWVSTDPNDLAPLVGTTWSFNYTINNSFTDTLTFGSIVQTTAEGYVGLSVVDQHSSPGAVFYMDLPQGGRGFGALTESSTSYSFYFFTVIGNTATGYYGPLEKPADYVSYLYLYPMSGTKISGPSTTTTIPKTTTTTSIRVTTTTSINTPPHAPSNPYPADGEINVPVNVVLTWEGGDPDGADSVTYDIYLGSGSLFGFYKRSTTGRCKVNFMKSSAIYKWQVVAKDSNGATTEGPIWTFVTEEGSSGCAAESVLADDPESLNLLRQFRDDVLAKSEKGNALIELYYQKSPLIVELIEKDPALKEKCRESLKAIMPSIRKIVNNKGDLRN